MAKPPANNLGVAATATGPSSIVEAMMDSAAMRQALATTLLGNWPEDRKFQAAEQPKAVAQVLIEAIHKHLVNVPIGFLYRETLAKRDREELAISSRVGGKLNWYSRLEFLVEINWSTWSTLTKEQRVACMDRALCHFSVEDSEKGTRYVLVAPDVEEFGAVVRRWGLWRPALRKFEAAIAQRDLFEVEDETDEGDGDEPDITPEKATKNNKPAPPRAD